MLSGIGGPAHLAEHGIPVRVARDGVGQNLQDHVDYVACFETPGTAFMGRSLQGRVDVVRALLRWKWSRSGMMTTPYAEAGWFLTGAPGAPAPPVKVPLGDAPREGR